MTKGELKEALDGCYINDDDAPVFIPYDGKLFHIVRVDTIGFGGPYGLVLKWYEEGPVR